MQTGKDADWSHGGAQRWWIHRNGQGLWFHFQTGSMVHHYSTEDQETDGRRSWSALKSWWHWYVHATRELVQHLGTLAFLLLYTKCTRACSLIPCFFFGFFFSIFYLVVSFHFSEFGYGCWSFRLISLLIFVPVFGLVVYSVFVHRLHHYTLSWLVQYLYRVIFGAVIKPIKFKFSVLVGIKSALSSLSNLKKIHLVHWLPFALFTRLENENVCIFLSNVFVSMSTFRSYYGKLKLSGNNVFVAFST